MPQKQLQVLIDLEFDGSPNEFEEFYGDTTTYQEVEQESYIDFKGMVTDYIGKVKFRKARDISKENSLTCRLHMNVQQYQKFEAIYQGEEINQEKSTEENPVYYKFTFLHDFKLCNLRLEGEETEE